MATRPTPGVLELYKAQRRHAGSRARHGASSSTARPRGDSRFATRRGIFRAADIEQVRFAYADYHETLKRYPIDKLKEGWNTMPDGEEIFYISTPSAGLLNIHAR